VLRGGGSQGLPDGRDPRGAAPGPQCRRRGPLTIPELERSHWLLGEGLRRGSGALPATGRGPGSGAGCPLQTGGYGTPPPPPIQCPLQPGEGGAEPAPPGRLLPGSPEGGVIGGFLGRPRPGSTGEGPPRGLRATRSRDEGALKGTARSRPASGTGCQPRPRWASPGHGAVSEEGGSAATRTRLSSGSPRPRCGTAK
jgi:hypothetical protein